MQTIQLLNAPCMMDLGQYQENNIKELEGIESWAVALENQTVRWVVIALQFLRPASALIAGIHGYKRHDDNWGAAAAWGALGFLFPVITPGVALIQGYGKPKSEAFFGRY